VLSRTNTVIEKIHTSNHCKKGTEKVSNECLSVCKNGEERNSTTKRCETKTKPAHRNCPRNPDPYNPGQNPGQNPDIKHPLAQFNFRAANDVLNRGCQIGSGDGADDHVEDDGDSGD